MDRALQEARKGVGLTAPNPPVGAVLVYQEEELASGWHKRAGELHAEREALLEASRKGISREILKDSTLYVTLEPCSTQGRTPPCTDGIIEAGVGRVVYGTQDPDPRNRGAADALLTAAGVSVLSGVREESCRRLLRPFTMAVTEGRPWVIAKTAFSVDGKVVRPRGEGQWLSGTEARYQVHVMRTQVDAILTSGATIRDDNPALTIRGVETEPWKLQPIRAIVTRHEESLSRQSVVFTDEFRDRTRVYHNIPLPEVLRRLTAEENVHSVLLEMGPTLMAAFLQEGLVDEWVAYVAPLICGGPYPEESRDFSDEGFCWMPVALDEVSLEKTGSDLCIRGVVRR